MSDRGAEEHWISQWIAQQRQQWGQFADALNSRSPSADESVARVHGQIPPDAWAHLMHGLMRGPSVVANLFSALAQNGAPHADAQASSTQQGWHIWTELPGKIPPLGLAREQVQSWRDLHDSQQEYDACMRRMYEVLIEVHLDSLEQLEMKVRELGASGQVIAGFRELYDLWVECAERIFSGVAHSEAYSKLQAELINAGARLRTQQQRVIEQQLQRFDLPTRAELNSVHRQLREMREELARLRAHDAESGSRGSQ